MKAKLKAVTKADPCAVCGDDHKCSRGDDGLLICGRSAGEVAGFVYLRQSKGDDQFGLYRRVDDPVLERNRRTPPQSRLNNAAFQTPETNGHAINSTPRPVTDWEAKVNEHVLRLDGQVRTQLADALGVPESALAGLAIGAGEDGTGKYWTFPEVDAAGKVIGVVRRYEDGRKMAMPGGSRGLTLPDGWDCYEAGDLLLLPEGASDVLACRALGLPVVGRPSNTGGVELLADFLNRLSPERRPMPVVVGEYDPKPDGSWPGREGALKTAAKLQAKLGGDWSVSWVLPPKGSKDLRAWVVGLDLPHDCADAWCEAGDDLVRRLKAHLLKPPAEAGAEGYRLEAINSQTFFANDYRREWLVKRLLVRGRPTIWGGPKKCLKTTTLADLSVSLASGTPFLGYFEVYRRCRVLMISGESGEAVLQEVGRRVCDQRGVNPADLDIHWAFRLPQFASPLDRAALEAGLNELKPDVVIIDPLYLCLLAGLDAKDLEAGNLFHMGPLLLGVARSCLNVGATPILAHHSRKNLTNPHEPMELEDLAYAGCQEFAAQWVLINRSEPFDPDTGASKLWLVAGGRDGQCGCWAVDVEEGLLNDDFSGRRWEVTVRKGSEAREDLAERGDAQKQAAQICNDKADDARLLRALDEFIELAERAVKKSGKKKAKGKAAAPAADVRPPTVTQLQTHSRLSPAKTQRAIKRLLQDEVLEDVEVEVWSGRNNKVRQVKTGYRRAKKEAPQVPTDLTDLTDPTNPFPSGQSEQSAERQD